MPQASEHRLGRARDPGAPVVTAQPRAGSRLPSGHRALSQERHAAPNGLSPAPKLRLLPPRPPPPPDDPRPKKLELERGRAAKRGDPAPRGPGGRRGPLKADHGVRVPGGAPQVPGSASFSLPSAAERRRSNLARSKSISIGDLSQGGGGGGSGGVAGVPSRAEDVAVALSRLVLRDCGHPLGAGALALRRSSSLRRVTVSTGPDGRGTAALLSVRPEGGPRARPEPAFGHGPGSPASGRTEDKAAALQSDHE